MTEPRNQHAEPDSVKGDAPNAIADATMADAGLQGITAVNNSVEPSERVGLDRDMPTLNRRRANHSATSWFMLAIIAVVLAGAVWTVRHLLTLHSEQSIRRRDDASAQRIAGKVFGDDASRPASSTPAASSPASAPDTGRQHSAGRSPNVSTGGAVHSYYDAPLLVGSEAPGSDLSGVASAVSAGISQIGSVQLQSSGQEGPLAQVLRPTATPTSVAGFLGDRNFLLTKGTTIDCVLGTALDSTAPGITSCTVTKNIYSDNGRVVLVERGTQVMGEYQANVRQGQRRIFVLWDRLKTPHGVIVELDSPAADALGRTGFDGYVDNHWTQRLGAAFMLSAVQDAIGYASSRKGSANGTMVFQNTEQTGNDEASRILDSTINIAPTLGKNQGDRVSIYLARDLDFSGVYALRPEMP